MTDTLPTDAHVDELLGLMREALVFSARDRISAARGVGEGRAGAHLQTARSRRASLLLLKGSAAWTLAGTRIVARAPALLGFVDLFPTGEAIEVWERSRWQSGEVPREIQLAQSSGAPAILERGLRELGLPPLSDEWIHLDGEATFAEVPHMALGQLRARGAARFEGVLNTLRRLSMSAGWDPFVAALKDKASDVPIFVDVPEHGPDLKDWGMRLTKRSFRASESWQPLLEQGGALGSMLLLLDGHMRTKVDIGSPSAPAIRTVDAVRAPVLVGEFERPFAAAGKVSPVFAAHPAFGALPAGAGIEVLPEPERADVLALEVPYAELVRMESEYPSVSLGLSAHVRQQTLRWIPLLGAGRSAKWRVLTALRDAVDRASARHERQLILSRQYLIAKAHAGSNGSERSANDELPKLLRALRRQGVVRHFELDKRVLSLELGEVDREALRTELEASAKPRSGRDSPA